MRDRGAAFVCFGGGPLPNTEKHTHPDCIVFGVEPGVTPSPKPPVRIFLGTQAEQFRPERVFFWSLLSVRDPSRVYEVYLMKALDHFRGTRFWNTGFTNYRFAIPYFGGYEGRAIYNDVDQTYHADPAELFDMDMGDHAVLAVSRKDTSVMLMDCARMKKYWPIERVYRGRKYPLIAAVLADEGAYGHLDERWNVRDTEHIEGETKCYHYTILHYQPWRPLPERFYYRPNVEGGELWENLEKEADAAGFHVFSKQRPSFRFKETGGVLDRSQNPQFYPNLLSKIGTELVERTSAETTLLIHDKDHKEETVAKLWGSGSTHSLALQSLTEKTEPIDQADGVVITANLNRWSKEDLPWIIDEVFSKAKRFVVLAVHVPEAMSGSVAKRKLAMTKAAAWWSWACKGAATHHKSVYWRLALMPSKESSLDDVTFLSGGKHVSDTCPTVWVLTDEKPGHSTQSFGLIRELSWPFEEKKLRFNTRGELPNVLVKGTTASLKGTSDSIEGPPWPDLVIATGRRTVPISEWIRQESIGRTRTVQMGRIGTSMNDRFDIGVAPAYAGLYPDPRRLETATPITRVCETGLAEARQIWDHLKAATHPRVALLIGGTNAEHEFSASCAKKLGEEVASMVKKEGGSVFVSTSRRTSKAAADALLAALGDVCFHAHVWQRDMGSQENPYMGYLAVADAFVVTGESASMLAEACTTNKPVAIFPIPSRLRGLRAWIRSWGRSLGDAVAEIAYSNPTNRRGIERPQKGLQRFCAGLLAKGLVRTGGHSSRLHESLISRGLAQKFDGRLPLPPKSKLNEVRRVADRVRQVLGFQEDQGETPKSSPSSHAESAQ